MRVTFWKSVKEFGGMHFAGAPLGTKDVAELLLELATSEGDCMALLDVDEAGV